MSALDAWAEYKISSPKRVGSGATVEKLELLLDGEADCNGSIGIYEMMCRCNKWVSQPWRVKVHLKGERGGLIDVVISCSNVVCVDYFDGQGQGQRDATLKIKGIPCYFRNFTTYKWNLFVCVRTKEVLF